MSVLFYEMSIPVYVRSLRQLSVILKQGEQWAADNAVPPERLLKAKLAPDMLALPFQVHSATNTALLGLGGLPQPMPIRDLAETVTFADLHGYIDTGLEKLTAVEPKSWAGKDESSMVVHRLGKDWEVAPVAYMQVSTGLPSGDKS